MVLNGCKMDIDCLRKTQSFDRLVLERFPPRRERGQQGAAQRQQDQNRRGCAQDRGREIFCAWIHHAAGPDCFAVPQRRSN